MITRKEYEELEEKILAHYACKSASSRGRKYKEEEHPYRTAFQRDRDRIIHSNAFRRLEYKTQVFVFHEGDHYRTRLTHTLEGAQISRTIARALRLNEELTEAIILAHDLGHTPFGHSGQDIMNRLMKDEGGFEHNRQSLRIVTLLEKRYPGFPGLNLTCEVLEGIAKHLTAYDAPGIQFEKKGFPSLEAQIVDLADEIAYCSHDLDDGLSSGLISLDELKDVRLWAENFERVRGEYGEGMQIRQTVKSIINRLVTDLVNATERNIEAMKINSLDDARAAHRMCISFSDEVDVANRQLKDFLYQNLYRHYQVERMTAKAETILRDLFDAYSKNPRILPPDIFAAIGTYSEKRVICDYIAGMTDRFALDEHAKLFDPKVRV